MLNDVRETGLEKDGCGGVYMNKDKSFKWLSIVLILLLLLAFAAEISVFSGLLGNFIGISTNIFSILAIIVAFYYSIMGYGKIASKAYRIYMLLLAIVVWTDIVRHAMHLKGVPVAYAVGGLSIQFACLVVIALAENLGKKKSYTLCWIVLAIAIINFMIAFIFSPGFARGGGIINTIRVVRTGSDVLLIFIAYLITIAKYKDKEMRGTK